MRLAILYSSKCWTSKEQEK